MVGTSEGWLESAAVVAGVTSSALIDAVAVGVPVFVAADARRELPHEIGQLAKTHGPSSDPWATATAGVRDELLPLTGSDAATAFTEVVATLTGSREAPQAPR